MATSNMLLLIGSGPGIGVAVASYFAQQHFNRVALLARTTAQLQKDRESVLAAAAAQVNREVQVKTWQVDISDIERLQRVLEEVEQFGRLECVYFNAARVDGSVFFQFPIAAIEYDFRVSNLALYATARWAMPLLLQGAQSQEPGRRTPAFLVTSSLLPLDPIPQLFTLSMVKAAQANLVKSLAKTFSPEGVHIGLVVVGGMVSADAPALNPGNIAEQAWKLFSQEQQHWTEQVTIHEDGNINWSPSI